MTTTPEAIRPQTYVKRPVEIKAIQFRQDDFNTVHAIIDWMIMETPQGEVHPYDYRCNNAWDAEKKEYKENVMCDGTHHTLVIKTLEGEMEVSDGWYVVQGTQGEFYPCKPDIFEAIHDLKVSDDASSES